MKSRSMFGFRSLFFKIFISFWLTMALIIGALNLMFRLSNMESLPERATKGAFGEALTLYAEQAARVYRNLAKVDPSNQLARVRLAELAPLQAEARDKAASDKAPKDKSEP